MAFVDRRDAGRRLAALLVKSGRFEHEQPAAVVDLAVIDPPVIDPVVMGMARGGVPVAFEVARALDAPLEVVVVRKLGHPRQPELGLGAIAEDGVRVINDALVAKLGVPEDVIDAVATQERVELERRLACVSRGSGSRAGARTDRHRRRRRAGDRVHGVVLRSRSCAVEGLPGSSWRCR